MTARIRLIKPVEPPPKGKPVQWFYADGTATIAELDRPAALAVAWCLPAQLDGTPSGPVHSLEAQELPEPHRPVMVRINGHWHEGMRDTGGEWRAWSIYPTDFGALVKPDAWRHLDDEPDALAARVTTAAYALGDAWRTDRGDWTGVGENIREAGNALEFLTREERPLDAEPGDAELLQAARRALATWEGIHTSEELRERMRELRAATDRSGK